MKLITSLLLIILLVSCNEKSKETNHFDTKEMLSNITDQIILPSIHEFNTSCINLNFAVEEYIKNPNEKNVLLMQTKWKVASINYAKVYAFNIGEAKKRFFHLKLYNWPTFSIAIENLISKQKTITKDYVSNLSSQAKTLSGIEYLLFHKPIAEIHQELLNSKKRLDYLKFIVLLEKQRAQELVNLWDSYGENYKDNFMENSKKGVNSSVNLLFNGIYNIISTVKISKLGKTAGLEKSKNINKDELQARYSRYSKELIIENLKISKKVFFNKKGLGLSNNISAITGNENLNNLLNKKFDNAINSLQKLNGSLNESITNSPEELKIIHKQLQEIIILLSIDIRSILSIIITPTDNDGD
jgi:predicted lipoprotein